MPQDPIASRILAYQRAAESDRAFAMRIGTNSQNVGNWRAGVVPRLETIKELCEENGWSEDWVLHGRGRRYAGKEKKSDVSAFADGIRFAAVSLVRCAQELVEEASRIDGVGLEVIARLELPEL